MAKEIDLKSREYYLEYITPHPSEADPTVGEIKANQGDLLIFTVELLLDIRDLMIDVHGILSELRTGMMGGARPGGPRLVQASSIIPPVPPIKR